jgi:hypothetical protein
MKRLNQGILNTGSAVKKENGLLASLRQLVSHGDSTFLKFCSQN